MQPERANEDAPEALVIEFDGGIADQHELTLDRYVDSIVGWRDFFTLATELYLRSMPRLRDERRLDLFQFRIEAERPGSYKVYLLFILSGAAAGIIGNRADAAFVALCKALWNWYKAIISNHVTVKKDSKNIDDIVAALEAMTADHGVDLAQSVHFGPVANGVAEDDLSDDVDVLDVQSPGRKAVEKIDTALKLASAPIGSDCNFIRVSDRFGATEIASFGAFEKEVLDSSLTLPPPSGIWTRTSVKFERINNKTGRALIYVSTGTHLSDTASYARIMDPAFKEPGNVYAKAFLDNRELDVWSRQVRAERGRLNLMWQITHKPPEQLSLFGPEGSRA